MKRFFIVILTVLLIAASAAYADNDELSGKTREEVIDYYMVHSINKVNERFDTDDYTFLYAGFYGTPHGGASIYLLRVDKDGSYHNYVSDLNKRSYGKGAQITDVTVDRENEKVHIMYDKAYTIDLKTGEFTGDDDVEFVSAYPTLPENGREHYVVYKEGYRDNRVELAMYDGSYVLLWDKDSEEKHLGASEGDVAYKNDIKYYLDGDKWVEFEQGYNCVSNNATAVLETDVKVVRNYQPTDEEYPQTIPVHPNVVSGTVAGDMYYTDIKAYVFDAPITSYNIGGRTVIDTEILSGYYGFDVTWHENERWLEVTDAQTTASSEALSGTVVEGADGVTGEKAGVYYNTDIVTTLNGKEIEAYNIGGRTFLVAENMRDFEYIVDWNEESRELRVSRYPSQTEEYTDVVNTDMVDAIPVNNLKSEENNRVRSKGSYMLFADKKTYYLPLKYGFVYNAGGLIQYVRLSEIVKALNADYEIKAEKTNDGYDYTLIINYDKTDIPYLSDTNPDGENSFRKGDTIGKGFIKYLSEYKIPMTLLVNGETPNMNQVAGIKDLDFHILVLNGEIWMPTNPLNAMFGFDAI